MLKQDMVDILKDKVGEKVSRKVLGEIIDTIFEEIVDAAVSEDPYYHRGFGGFELIERKKRNIHNVHSGKVTPIPAKLALKFTPARSLNKWLNS